ncbi:hypothetical protein, partial [Mesorhizobium sp. M7A.F.Ca.US.005.03.2.1]|uniref:hypothetical protein n=1 Tax=Mesorhizobium sp. M7A.F.Ca.US.005.03.2.1 TaxID=2496737 RepID=UPI0019D28CB2
MTNNAIWTTGGTSLFGAGNDSVINGAGAMLTTASNGGMIEATTFDGLAQLTSSGPLTMQDG